MYFLVQKGTCRRSAGSKRPHLHHLSCNDGPTSFLTTAEAPDLRCHHFVSRSDTPNPDHETPEQSRTVSIDVTEHVRTRGRAGEISFSEGDVLRK